MTPLPLDLQRAVGWLFALAIVCLVLAALYTNQYLFVGPMGETLPDISPTDFELVRAFQIGAVACALWALALVALATPVLAERFASAWARAANREGDAPRAWLAAVGAALVYTAVRFAFAMETIHAPLSALTAGDALLPFQYRALVPAVVHAAIWAVPALEHVDLRLLYAPIEAAAAVGVWAAVAALLRALDVPAASARLAALGVFVPLLFNLAAPWRYNAVFFPYDTLSVAFFALGLALLLRRAWWPFYALFVIATFNRETTCFLAVAWVAVALGRERLPVVAGHAVAQALLWIAIKAALAAIYAANAPLDAVSGGLFASMVGRSARILTSVPGFVYVLVVAMGALGPLLFVLRHRMSDERLRRLFWIVPPFLAGMAVVGELMEVRIYSELIPLVVVGLFVSLRSVVWEAARVSSAVPDLDLSEASA